MSDHETPVPEWRLVPGDEIQNAVIKAIRETFPEMVQSIEQDHPAANDPTFTRATVPRPAPTPEPEGPTQDQVAGWSRAAIKAGALEEALPDIVHRIQTEQPLSVSLVDPTAECQPLGEFLDGLKLALPSYFVQASEAKGNGKDHRPDPWE